MKYRIVKRFNKNKKQKITHNYYVQEQVEIGLFKKKKVWQDVYEELYYDSLHFCQEMPFKTLAEAKGFIKPLPKEEII